LRIALFKGPNRVRVLASLTSPEDGNRSSFRNVVFSCIYISRQWTKVQKASGSEEPLSLGGWVKCRHLLHVADAYTTQHLVYQWQSGSSVDFVKGMALSQFDLISFPQRNLTFKRRDGKIQGLRVSVRRPAASRTLA
jgi:hypothetical protein